MIQIIFVIIAALGLLTALGTVMARNLVHAALFLIAFFFTIACQFVLLEAEFLAALQVLVYIGAVAIILMFGIMLTRNVQGDDPTAAPSAWQCPGLIVGLGLFTVLAFGISFQDGGPRGATWALTDRRPSVPIRGPEIAGDVPRSQKRSGGLYRNVPHMNLRRKPRVFGPSPPARPTARPREHPRSRPDHGGCRRSQSL